MQIKGQVANISPVDSYFKSIIIKRRNKIKKETETYEFIARRSEYKQLAVGDIVKVKFDKRPVSYYKIDELWVLMV